VRHHSEAGETLVEIVLTIVLIGVTVGALVAGLATAAGASKQHRDLTTADTVMRSYAEATKEAVRGCQPNGSYVVDYVPPSGFSVSGAGSTCPPVTGSGTTSTLTLIVADGDGSSTSMQIVVRTP
jgi:type II secretory pathway pseudopilin PulG